MPMSDDHFKRCRKGPTPSPHGRLYNERTAMIVSYRVLKGL